MKKTITFKQLKRLVRESSGSDGNSYFLVQDSEDPSIIIAFICIEGEHSDAEVQDVIDTAVSEDCTFEDLEQVLEEAFPGKYRNIDFMKVYY